MLYGKRVVLMETGGNSNNRKISVIIPVFNTEKYLLRCLDSVLIQTFTDFELILVDDCSPDGSPAICDEYAGRDLRVKVMHNAQNQGSSKARKTGLDVSAGDYVLFADSDDWLENDMLKALYGKAIDEKLDIVCCDLYIEKADGVKYKNQKITGRDKTSIIKQLLSNSVWHNLWNKLIKKDICKKIIFPDLSNGEDWVIIVQAVYYAERIGFLSKALYHYCLNSESITNNQARRLKCYDELYKNMKTICDFLLGKFNGNISFLEPELSACINTIKLPFLLVPDTRDVSRLYILYPESNKNIFKKSWQVSLMKRWLFYFSLHNFFLPLKLFDLFKITEVVGIIRKIYRRALPINIRLIILKLRNIEDDDYA
jgi:glycosyltransferase involved in cell wall biosynthesis